MFTSDKRSVFLTRAALGHLAAAALCALFGAVYERFSHGVYSYYMIYAFALPMMLGALPLLLLALRGRAFPGRTVLWLWNAGIAALTIGCLFRGALDIYGTTHRLTIVYPIVGGGLLAAGTASALASSAGNGRRGATRKRTPPPGRFDSE